MRELFNVSVLASANGVGALMNKIFAGIEPMVHFLVSVGQIGVATVTVIYIVKKIRSMKKKEKE